MLKYVEQVHISHPGMDGMRDIAVLAKLDDKLAHLLGSELDDFPEYLSCVLDNAIKSYLDGNRDHARDILPFVYYQIAYELEKAREKHPPMLNHRDGYVIIKEEVDELWDEIRAQRPSKEAMEEEVRQIGAMAIRFIEDVCRK